MRGKKNESTGRLPENQKKKKLKKNEKHKNTKKQKSKKKAKKKHTHTHTHKTIKNSSDKQNSSYKQHMKCKTKSNEIAI